MVSEWSTERILATGKRLSELIPQAIGHAKRKTDELEKLDWEIAIAKAIITLQELRKEYKRRL